MLKMTMKEQRVERYQKKTLTEQVELAVVVEVTIAAVVVDWQESWEVKDVVAVAVEVVIVVDDLGMKGRVTGFDSIEVGINVVAAGYEVEMAAFVVVDSDAEKGEEAVVVETVVEEERID